MWKPSGDPLLAPNADHHILNCVRTHPIDPVIATSGIESSIKLWAPSSPMRALTDEVRRSLILLALGGVLITTFFYSFHYEPLILKSFSSQC